MLAARTTQQGRLKMLLRLCSFVGVALVLIFFAQSSHAADCGKDMGGTKKVCTKVSKDEIYKVPLDFYKNGLEINKFEGIIFTSRGQQKAEYTVHGSKNGDLLFLSLNVAESGWDANLNQDLKSTYKAWGLEGNFGALGPIKKIKVHGGYGRRADVEKGCSFFIALRWSKKYWFDAFSCGEATTALLAMFADKNKPSPEELMASKNMHAGGNSSSTSVSTKSAEYRACQTAKGDSSKTAKFMQSLTQPQLTKFLNKNQSCDAF